MKTIEAMRRWLPWLGFTLFGAAACQVVVGETELTTVHCQAEGAVGPPACAAGQVCLSGVCVSESSAADGGGGTSGSGGTGEVGGTGGGTGGGGGTAGNPDAGDASDAPDDGAPPDVGPDVPTDTPVDSPPDVVDETPVMKALGENCDTNAECNSGHCFQVPNKSAKVCSKFCCGSSECTLLGGVCVAYGGANACFAASQLDLVLGTKSVGETCNNGVECATGRCSGTCIDSCCNTASGCNCALASYGGQVNWYCGGPSGSSGNMAGCSASTSCSSNNCETFNNGITFTVFTGTKCAAPCCSDDDCNDGYCEYVWQGSNAVRQCTPWSTGRPSDHRPCCGDSSCSGSCQYVTEDAFDTDYSLFSTKEAGGFRCL